MVDEEGNVMSVEIDKDGTVKEVDGKEGMERTMFLSSTERVYLSHGAIAHLSQRHPIKRR